jgi:anti-sigma factor RsiW
VNGHVVEQLSPLMDSELTRAEREAVEQHLEACAECSAAAQEMRRAVAGLRALPTARMPQPVHIPHLRAPRNPSWWARRHRLVIGSGSALLVGAAAAATALLSTHGSPSVPPQTAVLTPTTDRGQAVETPAAAAAPPTAFGGAHRAAVGSACPTSSPQASLSPPPQDTVVVHSADGSTVLAVAHSTVAPGTSLEVFAGTRSAAFTGVPCIVAGGGGAAAAATVMQTSGSQQVVVAVPADAQPGQTVGVAAVVNGAVVATLTITVS